MYFPTVKAAAAYDKETHKFMLDEVCKALCEHLISFISLIIHADFNQR